LVEKNKILKINDLIFDNVLKNFNFEIDVSQNSINSIICFDNSASSLLKIVGNAEENFKGEVTLNENLRAIYIPKNPSSLPWLSVEENIKFILENSSYKEAVAQNQVQNLIDDVGLTGYEKHFPANNSLGFRFRISLAGTLALKSSLILVDNSLKQMDEETKFELYDLLKKISSKYNVSFLLASNDINEVIYLSENIYLMKAGNSKIIDKINLKEEWQKLNKEGRGNRQLQLKEKILHLFLQQDVNNIL